MICLPLFVSIYINKVQTSFADLHHELYVMVSNRISTRPFNTVRGFGKVINIGSLKNGTHTVY